MSRIHFWQFLRDEDGRAVQGANISIYLAGGTTPAYIYLDELGGSSVGTAPQLQTNSEGYFEFWIGDDAEIHGYHTSQKFKIAWEKVGIAEGYIDWIEVFPPIIPVDETDVDPVKNKAVSNLQAKLWTDHVYDSDHLVHGIEEVDVTSTNTTKNKLVSNAQAKEWTDALSALAASPVDETDTNLTKDKLVSNGLAKEWTDHSSFLFTGTLGTSADNAHGLEAANLADNDNVFNKLVSNQLLNSIKASGVHIYNEIIDAGDFTLNGTTGLYDYTITHSLNYMHPQVTVYEESTDDLIFPANVHSTDQNNSVLSLATAIQVKVTCIC